jgi:hypothetical protein
MNTTDLMKLFEFDLQDLEANRVGKLSTRQAAILNELDSNETLNLSFGLLLLGLFFLPICAVCAFFFNIQVLLNSLLTPGVIGLSVVSLAIVVSSIAYANWKGRQERAKLPPVTAVTEDTLKFRVDDRGAKEFYYLVVGDGKELRISFNAFHSLQRYQPDKPDHIRYRFYHSTHGRHLLSAEIISEPLSNLP